MKLRLLAAASGALIVAAGQAHAGDDRWSLSATEENDAWNFKGDESDRNYTQGLQLALMSPAETGRSLPALVRIACFLEHAGGGCNGGRDDAKVRIGFELGQNIYTPTLKDFNPDANDRPYAGWLYGGAMFGSYSRAQANTIELQIGEVGKDSHAGQVQSWWHHNILNIPIFDGWNHQLKDEVAFVVIGERRWKPNVLWPRSGDRSGWAVDSPYYVDFSAGTLRVAASTGRMLRVGYGLESDFGPPRIRPAPSGSVYIDRDTDLSAYVFAGIDAEAVARDLFLDGNTFRHHSPHVEKRWLVGEGMMGAEFRWRGFRLAYTYVTQTEQFYSQHTPQHFTSINVTWHGWWAFSKR